jgi:hypothetical protein
MKSVITALVTLFAVAAFAAEPAAVTAPTVAPTPTVAKDAKKPVKSHKKAKTAGAKKADAPVAATPAK